MHARMACTLAVCHCCSFNTFVSCWWVETQEAVGLLSRTVAWCSFDGGPDIVSNSCFIPLLWKKTSAVYKAARSTIALLLSSCLYSFFFKKRLDNSLFKSICKNIYFKLNQVIFQQPVQVNVILYCCLLCPTVVIFLIFWAYG